MGQIKDDGKSDILGILLLVVVVVLLLCCFIALFFYKLAKNILQIYA